VTVSSAGMVSTTGSVSIGISSAGSAWTTLKNWTASGTTYASLNKVWAVNSGYKYRVYATFRIYDSNGTIVETATNTDTYNYS